MQETPQKTTVPKITTVGPLFSGQVEAGQAAPVVTTTRERRPTAVHLIITEADLPALAEAGGAEIVGETLTEEIEKHGLRRILQLLDDLDTGASS